MRPQSRGMIAMAALFTAGAVLAAAAGLTTARIVQSAAEGHGPAGIGIPPLTLIQPAPAGTDGEMAEAGPAAGTGSVRNETVIAKTSTAPWPPLAQARPAMAPREGRAPLPHAPAEAAPCAWGQCQDI